MVEGRVHRRLAAILAADVVGYSRLMEADEGGTLAALKARRTEVLKPLVAKHRGRVIKLMGDGALLEFQSAVNAVECAVALQRAMAERNAAVPENKRIALRVGVNLGDLIAEGSDIYGDCVNVAARLEALAEPGGICVSGKVHDEVARKLDFGFEELGLRQLKNITAPVRIYRVRADESATRAGGEPTPVPSKPAIAVLPFTNLSGDPEQEYFSDGVAEDIITELSRLRWLDVIARGTTFAYKGEATNLHELCRALRVQYVLSGSVRRAGGRVRITAHLLEAETGKQLWAHRFDHDLEDIFAVQDEITELIVATLPGRIEAAGLEQARCKSTENLAAYEYLLRAKDHHHRGTREDNGRALELLDKAIALDPNSAQAYAWKACTLGQALVRGYGDPDFVWKRMVTAVEKALALDEDDFECHRLLGYIHLFRRQYDRAWFHYERAFELNPNDPRILSQRGEFLTWAGRPEEAVPWLEKALRLDPYRPDGRLTNLGVALHAARRYEDAAAVFRKIANLGYEHHAYLASCYARMGLELEGRCHADEVLRLKPDFRATRYVQGLPYQHEADRKHHLDGLAKAGLSA